MRSIGSESLVGSEIPDGLVASVLFIGLLGAIAVNGFLTWRNAYVHELLSVGWIPLIVAMLISWYAALAS